MNPALITRSIKEAIQTIPKKEWEDFFQALQQEQYHLLSSTPKEDLTALQQRVIVIDEIKHLFNSTRKWTNAFYSVRLVQPS